MKNYLSYIAIILVLLFASCKKDEVVKPKVIYEDTAKSKPTVAVDTTQIEVAVRPEGHPVGPVDASVVRRDEFVDERAARPVEPSNQRRRADVHVEVAIGSEE